jgi:hypothetical protein
LPEPTIEVATKEFLGPVAVGAELSRTIVSVRAGDQVPPASDCFTQTVFRPFTGVKVQFWLGAYALVVQEDPSFDSATCAAPGEASVAGTETVTDVVVV